VQGCLQENSMPTAMNRCLTPAEDLAIEVASEGR
jgi:hypothetical protein